MTHLQAVPTQSKSRHKEYRRPLIEILNDLAQPIPDRFLEKRKQGGIYLIYIPWYNVCKLLDFYAPGWHGQVTQMITTDNRIFLSYRLTIEAEEGSFSREATGTEVLVNIDHTSGEVKELAYGDPSSNAESMAFRRAAAKFGLGLDLYDKGK